MKKYSGIIVILALVLMPLAASAFSNQGCSGDCKECHKLDKKEADGILKKGNPKANVEDVKLSPIGGLWQIDFEVEGKHGAVLMDFSKKYILEVRQLIPIESLGKPAPQKKVDFSKIPLKEAIVLGPKKAKKKVVVFTDPDCPFCKKLHEEIKQLLTKRNDVAFYIVLFPLPMHKGADKKAQAIQCEKSLALLDDAFAGKTVPEPKCANGQIEKNIALANELGFGGTPTLVREDGLVLSGYLPADKLSEWVDSK